MFSDATERSAEISARSRQVELHCAVRGTSKAVANLRQLRGVIITVSAVTASMAATNDIIY
jgi:hypothetical protein